MAPGTLYFAYGSNLSPTQMALRLPHSPATSATPLAIARLDNYRWIICQAGYANVVKLPTPAQPAPRGPDDVGGTAAAAAAAAAPPLESTVYGVLYNLDPADEAVLDLYEGHTAERNPNPEPNLVSGGGGSNDRDVERPFHQGTWVYNKHYLRVHIVKWLADDDRLKRVESSSSSSSSSPLSASLSAVRVLVYVDEQRTQRGKINDEYVGRMNRAIAESTALGLSRAWVDAVVRKDVVPGVEVDDPTYIGRRDKKEQSES